MLRTNPPPVPTETTLLFCLLCVSRSFSVSPAVYVLSLSPSSSSLICLLGSLLANSFVCFYERSFYLQFHFAAPPTRLFSHCAFQSARAMATHNFPNLKSPNLTFICYNRPPRPHVIQRGMSLMSPPPLPLSLSYLNSSE